MARYASVWEGIDFDFEQTGSLPIAEYRFQMWIPIEEALVKKITVSLQERYIGMPTTFVVDALDSTHNNAQAFVQGVRDASRRISAGNPQFRRCSVQEHVSY